MPAKCLYTDFLSSDFFTAKDLISVYRIISFGEKVPLVKSSFTTLKLARLFLTEQARKYLTVQYLTYIWKAEGQIKREKGKKER